VRKVKCLSYGGVHDRDENAAKNINKVGMGHRHDRKRTQSGNKTTSVAAAVKRQESPCFSGGSMPSSDFLDIYGSFSC